MTHDEARAALEGLFAAGWTATPIAYENVAFTPPPGLAPWIRLAIEGGETAQASFGGSVRRFRCTGTLRVAIQVARGTGTAGAYRLADQVGALVAAAVIPGLALEAAATASEAGQPDGPYFRLTVAIPFWHDDFR
ncbi:phage tail terminator-like protein [Thalassobaculum sp. OXR-137]|uniref:phage tail terminator-like protein n=1 Tax=Thalassobaculum sp. OXR-137 TaxID=3100173 RepID=UPI002AC8F75F|nr:phage tail terminator-like protein [Thalassobaculum sp. OXR-137]WPZ36254.1 phage tail terminator-like protein [Thalassobaculum sp. OXR-137]